MERREVYKLCKEIAPRYQFDPLLILAICKQESNYDHRARRLEQGFFWRYTRNDKVFNDVDEVLLAASWGLMQMMGRSLYDVGYFTGNMYHDLIAYLDNPSVQIETGCKWLAVKRGKTSGDTFATLCLWNGDMTGRYAKEVIEKYEGLKRVVPMLVGEIDVG